MSKNIKCLNIKWWRTWLFRHFAANILRLGFWEKLGT